MMAQLIANSQKEPYIITLEPIQLKEQEFYVSEVVDFRRYKGSVGVAVKGLFDAEVPAKFSEDFVIHLTNTLNVLLPKNETRIPLTVRVRKLFVSESISTFYELGRCEVVLEFLRLRDSRYYSLGTFSSVVEKKGLDLTETHHERISDALTDCIYQFSKSDWKNTNMRFGRSKQKPHLFTTGNHLKRGLYLSFENMVSNSPVTDTEYDIKNIKRTKDLDRYQIYRKGTKKRIKNLFGFSDGKSVYISASTFISAQYFLKSKTMGRYIYFEDEFTLPGMGLAFGWIGALASLENRGIILDSESGLTTILTQENIESLLSDQPELLKEYKKSDKSFDVVKEMIIKLNAIKADASALVD
ncbi:hypothetical protein [Maribacter sp. 2210JD10-5]|uniref:hypothetical protein n=1 Tax=Maribacter sp. 2210JD10-5 TaxID=3386272 RepID=UPI0039BCE9CD